MKFSQENGGIALESNLTKRLRRSEFLCGIETYVYYRTIGKYTTLYLEAEYDEHQKKLDYNFYKMCCSPNGRTYFRMYCTRVPIQVALKRVESFALYLELHKDSSGRWLT